MNLSARLQAIHDFIPGGSIMADIGTDHGYIPVAACLSHTCLSAIAIDVAPGPLSAAQRTIQEHKLEGKIECRLGNGLACLHPGEVDGIVIAGMGGPMIQTILDADPSVVKKLHYMVLQPMRGCSSLRRYIYGSGWHIMNETIVLEDQRLYEIIYAVPGIDKISDDTLFEIGPINWIHKNPHTQQLLTQLIDKYQRIATGLEQSNEPKSREMNMVKDKIRKLEEKLWQFNCKK